jgi:hypothetical protein
MIWRHAPLVSEQDGHPPPLHVHVRQELITALRGSAAGEDQRARSAAKRFGDLFGGFSRNVAGGIEDLEIAHDYRERMSWAAAASERA